MNLAKDFLAFVKTVEYVADELDSVGLAGGYVLGAHNLTKAALSKQSEDLVLVSDLPPDGRQVDLLRILTFHV